MDIFFSPAVKTNTANIFDLLMERILFISLSACWKLCWSSFFLLLKIMDISFLISCRRDCWPYLCSPAGDNPGYLIDLLLERTLGTFISSCWTECWTPRCSPAVDNARYVFDLQLDRMLDTSLLSCSRDRQTYRLDLLLERMLDISLLSCS